MWAWSTLEGLIKVLEMKGRCERLGLASIDVKYNEGVSRSEVDWPDAGQGYSNCEVEP